MATARKRSYDSSGRQAKAAENRRAVVAAATELFLRDGYGQTTIAAVAARAGVSAETVYAQFGTKAELLRRAWDVTVGGDDRDVLVHEREGPRALRAERDLGRLLQGMARLTVDVARRTGPFLLMVQSAAGTEPAAADVLEEMHRQRLAGMGFMAAAAAATGQLAVTEEECRDVFWAMTDGVLWHRLVEGRGWSDERYSDWLARLWVSMLATPRAPRRPAGSRPARRRTR